MFLLAFRCCKENRQLGKLCKTSPLVWQASACHGILFAHEAIEP